MRIERLSESGTGSGDGAGDQPDWYPDEPAAAEGDRILRWQALPDGEPGEGRDDGLGDGPVGTAWLRLYRDEGRRHLARYQAAVRPDAVGRGIGTALLDQVRAAALAEGRGILLTRAGLGSEADGFLAGAGFTVGAETQRLLLRVADCDQDALRATVRSGSEGYHLVRWQGVAPADLIGSYAAARGTLNDTPTEGTDSGGAHWDEDRVRAVASEAEQRGDALLTVAALGLDGLGEEVVAGFSEVAVPRDTTRARQSDTAVLKEHRGRGLGLWVKAAMLQWLLGAHPEVEGVGTVCLAGNQHMIEINQALGFRPDGGDRYYRLALTEV
ncbi:GNAT family N-acetyltransferase [Streptacidiphilus sp. N1-12]|uniref:GNAT family N-acetyltransferase n=2 Tax=Streptacidiphilus alkalitolerans TaxID=3342712 RepID=A0ABV6V784_9ACTN